MHILKSQKTQDSSAESQSGLFQNFKVVQPRQWIYVTYENSSPVSLKSLRRLFQDKALSSIWWRALCPTSLHLTLWTSARDLLSHFSFCTSKSARDILSHTLLPQTSSLLPCRYQPQDSFRKLAPIYGDRAGVHLITLYLEGNTVYSIVTMDYGSLGIFIEPFVCLAPLTCKIKSSPS